MKDITVADLPCAPLRFGFTASFVQDVRNCARLPQYESDAHTGDAVLCWENRDLADLDEIEAWTFYDGNRTCTATIHHFVNDGETATFQLQCNREPNPQNKTARLCVKVQLTQVGPDIYAQAIYAKYWWSDPGEVPGAMDFDAATGTQSSTIRDDTHSDGYGVAALSARFKSSLRVAGAYGSEQDISVAGGTLSLCASSLTLGQAVSGTGAIRFTPADVSQTVTFGGSCSCDGGMILSGATTVAVTGSGAFGGGTPVALEDGSVLSVADGAKCDAGAATFSGNSTISVGHAASISFDSVSFADGAVVNLDLSRAKENEAVRVGTTASLTRAELAHFLVDGKPVKVQWDNGWLGAGVRGFTIIFK